MARSPNKVVPIHDGAEPLRASLDDTDLAIVRALQANARATYTEVGRAVGLSAASVHERVHRLETRGSSVATTPRSTRAARAERAVAGQRRAQRLHGRDRDRGRPGRIPSRDRLGVAGEDSHLLVVRTRSIVELSDVLQRLQGIDGSPAPAPPSSWPPRPPPPTV
jgi:Lrp/AsnC family leucine-responsive transcriptional regulator